MNFNIVEGVRTDTTKIHDDFVNDYIHSTLLSNIELQEKYDLTRSEFYELANKVKNEYNIQRRLKGGYGKYYSFVNGVFVIQKWINGRNRIFGRVPTEDIAIKVVKLCNNTKWNVDECKYICRNYEYYI